MELYERMLSGDAGCPVFDTEREAAQAAERLRGADVVLTTFDVLQVRGRGRCVAVAQLAALCTHLAR